MDFIPHPDSSVVSSRFIAVRRRPSSRLTQLGASVQTKTKENPPKLVESSHICREGDIYGKQFRLSHETGRTVRPALNPPRKLTTRLESDVYYHPLQTLSSSIFIRAEKELLIQPSTI